MQNPQQKYQQQQIMSASPLQLVVKLYDLLLQATYRKDQKRVHEVLNTLTESLNFDHEPAEELFQLYQYCQDLAREEKYEEIREVLEPLRDAWEQVANGNSEADEQPANA